jgi:hypothetical protein
VVYTCGGVLGLGAGPVTVKGPSASESFSTLLQAIEALQAMHPEAPRLRIAIIDREPSPD